MSVTLVVWMIVIVCDRYDVSGVSPDKIQNILEQDWTHLLRDQHILESPSYLRENDKPVVALWGASFPVAI